MDPQSLNSVDEDLVAAYVDGDVTTEERQRVEAAMAASEQVAWEVNTLRRTVELLQDLPSVPLPRSFTLTEDQVADVLQERRALAKVNASPPSEVEAPPQSPWQRFLTFLSGGDLALRNAAALAAVLLLLVFVAETGLQRTQPGSQSGGNEQLSSGPAVPEGQVTAVGGSLSQQPDSGAGGQSASEGGAEGAVADSSDEQDDDPQIGVMSIGDEGQQSASPEQEQAAAQPQPDTSSGAAATNQQQLSDNQGAQPADQPLVTVLRYARILLVLAVIVLWLLSRTKSRSRRA
ncbi:MAG: hypothetical protein OXK78_19670 [Caldilineaceae bacterium]|nr:hypothetical protein [Caldilineaceae bacterium]